MKTSLNLALSIMILLCCLMHTMAIAEPTSPVVEIGKRDSFSSTVLNKSIPLSIHLPESYKNSKRRYPVIYMMGSDYRTRFAMLASTLDYMADSQIPAFILVGIDLPEGNRVLLPARDTGATTVPDGYIQFLETELMRHIEKTYRTEPFNILFGASNSGFFTTYTLLKKPVLFNSYFATSPSLRAMTDELLSLITDGPLITSSKTKRLHIVYSDDDYDSVVNFVPTFSESINLHKPPTLKVRIELLENQGHVPASDFTQLLLAQFPDFNPKEDLDSLIKIKNHFDMLTKRYGYEMKPPMALLFNLGVDLTRSKNTVEALHVFDYTLKVYPEDKKSYVGMGFLKRETGNIEQAKVMFKKALTIAPDYGLAKRLLESLEK